MIALPRDHQVSLRTREQVAASACSLREMANIADAYRIDVVDLIRRMTKGEFKDRGKLRIVFFDALPGKPPAFVRYEPFEIHVDQELWDLAQLGDPYSQYVLAHECGHIVLHDRNAKAFSASSSKYNFFGMEDVSAENQANWFADHLLLPDHIVAKCCSVDEIIIKCGVGRELATRRWPAHRRAKMATLEYSGDACPECQNFTLVRNGTCLKCETCGATTGCS